jgi:Plasma-membrane choline transporter
MGNPVVVQGVAVGGDPHYNPPPTYNAPPTSHENYGDNFVKGEKQESKCRDPIFALLMYGNLIAIVVTVIVLKDQALLILDTNTTSAQNYTGYIYAALICGVFAMIFSGIMLIVMMQIPSFLIKTSLIFVVVMSGVWAVMGFIWGNILMGIIGVVFFLIGICYARAVWSRIPFATANLVTGCTAIRGNCGVIFTTFVFEALAFGWTMLWCLACLATFNSTYSCTQNAKGQQVCTQVNYGYLFLLLLSYYFTHQVIQNTVHVIVAGTVGTWWFSPEDSGCCSSGVMGATVRYETRLVVQSRIWFAGGKQSWIVPARVHKLTTYTFCFFVGLFLLSALTTSFGSICFGSLIAAIVQALRALANEAQNNGDAALLACIAQCILGCIQSCVEYFNKWAFIYVGLYGYSYLEAGKNVITLFKNRGWDAIIADDLIGNVLLLVSIIVGAITGVVGIVVQTTSSFFVNSAGNETAIAFL